MNSEHLIRGSFSNFPIVPLQHEQYQQWLPVQKPLPHNDISRNIHNLELVISLNRGDVARSVIEGQVSQQVAHSLVEDPKILMRNMPSSNPALMDSGERPKGGKRR